MCRLRVVIDNMSMVRKRKRGIRGAVGGSITKSARAASVLQHLRREAWTLTLRDHETTRPPSTQPMTTKLPRLSAWRAEPWTR